MHNYNCRIVHNHNCHIVQDNPKMVFTIYAALKYFFSIKMHWNRQIHKTSNFLKIIHWNHCYQISNQNKTINVRLIWFSSLSDHYIIWSQITIYHHIIFRSLNHHHIITISYITILLYITISYYITIYHHIILYHYTTSAVAILMILLSRYTYDITITKTMTF